MSAKEAIYNVDSTRLIGILKALALAAQADVNCEITPEQCRTLIREFDYLRQEIASAKDAATGDIVEEAK